MDDIKTPKISRAQVASPTRRVLGSHNPRHAKPHATMSDAMHTKKSELFDLDTYVRTLKKRQRQNVLKYTRIFQKLFATTRRRIICGVSVAVLLLFVALPALQEVLNHKIYALSAGENAVLLPTHQSMANKLKLDAQKQTYMFNQDYKASDPATDARAGGSLIKAQINQDASKGLQVTDPINNVDFTIKPLFDLGAGQQQQNRVVFPAFNGGGHLVYTAGAVGVKQDVTLDHYIGDKLNYKYELDLGDTYAAKLEQNGSIGIYGSSLPLNGNISTGDAKDAALLKKARQSAVKDKLLFQLPAPKIKETNHHISNAQAKYELKGNTLNVVVTNLKKAAYPLSIDPTVTAASGYGLFSFDANIETNVYIDPSNNYIQRSSLTGGNLLTWASATSSAAASHFLGAAVVYGGTLYLIGGTSGTTTTNISNGGSSHLIEQSKINSDGTLAGFTDGNYSGLPAGGLARFQVLTYNGYIYLIDGINGFTSTAAGGTVSNNVYYTRVTSESYSAFSNGSQLKNWTTTTNKPSTAVYDYGATVYNGSLYVAGGLNSGGTAQTAVLYSNILPSGDLGTFNSGTALSSARSGMDMQAYNGHLYILGGNTGNVNTTTLTATTFYASIASDGSIADAAWKTGPTLVSNDGSTTQVMENLGTQFTMIYNGYLYAAGACGVVNASSACTTVLNYAQLAQINADGSLGTFFPNDFQNGGTATLARVGTPTFGYNGAMYSVGGCSAMNAGSVSCATTVVTSTYSGVNATIGDISNNRNPTALPVALYGHATVVLNGYIYILGGCLTITCDGVRSANFITYYALINSDGSLGSWSNNTNSQTANQPLRWDGQQTPGIFGQIADCAAGGNDQCGLAGIGAAVYNGYIYVVGGYDGANWNNAVYYQQPNATNGQTNIWTKSANTIANAAVGIGVFANNGFLYSIGGCTGSGATTPGIGCAAGAGSFYSQVQRSTIGAAGAPGAWTGTGAGTQMQLGAGIAAFGMAFYGGFIYLAGGIDATNAQESFVQRAKLDSSGNVVSVVTGLASGTWTQTTGSMSQARRRSVAQVVNGYLYVIGGHNAADPTGPPGGANGTTYGDIQIGKIDLSSGSTGNIASFTQSATSTLTARWNPAVAFGDGFIYVTGGCTAGPPAGGCTTVGTVDESFVVYNADNLGVNTWNTPAHTYSSSSPDPAIANRLGAGAVAYNGYLYVVGGCTTYTMATLTCSLATTDVVYAPINADGTLGTWVASTALGSLYAHNQLVALNGTLYLLTGQNSTGVAKSIVRYSVIGASGAPGTWTDSSNSLANLRTLSGVTVYANRIYVAGGWDGTTNSNIVYYSPALPNGGDITSAWSATTSSFTTARRELSLVTAGAYLYVIGGYDGTNYYADVQMATPNTSTGDISSWSFIREIPYKEASMSAVGSNGYIYLFGGRNGTASTSCSKNTYFAAVNGNGTVSDWQQTPNQLASARFGTGVGYSNGYFFLTGGHDCTNIISSNVIQQSGQLSEAIHATYTRYVDFGTDATFRQLYVLGTNAQISGTDIDRWKIIVKTSTSVNNSWGQKFTTTLTGLGTGPNYGTAITFQALDGSGVDQGAAQYWDLTFDIDQSQSFNFPDTTQPQITKYDFYFSPGPGKRLRDGKTFINETQTTLDAHP